MVAQAAVARILFAMARDGKSYENTYSWFLKMRDGKIIAATVLYDPIAFDDLWKRIRPVY